MIITLISVTLACQLLLFLIALSGIKFYTVNSNVEEAGSDAKKIKFLTYLAFIVASAATSLIIFI